MEQVFFEGLSEKLELGKNENIGTRAEYRYALPDVMDISDQEGICLEVTLLKEGTAELEIALCPLAIARPEFFPAATARVRVMGLGRHHLKIPFGQFDFRQMVRAFLNYMDSICVRLSFGVPVMLHKMGAGIMGDFCVRAKHPAAAVTAGEWAEYQVIIANDSDRKRLVNVTQCKYGKECLPVEYEPYVLLGAKERKEYVIKVFMTGDIPAGGLEKSQFLFVPDGDGAKARKLMFLTVGKRKHPYLTLSQNKWQERRGAIMVNPQLYRAFDEKYGRLAREWEVPAASEREEYVYPAYIQNALFASAVAFQVIGGEAYREKVLLFFAGLTDEKKGYLATKKSYFEFIETAGEYARGDFKVRCAQDAGWVQEAEFFNRVALCYDLLFESFSAEEHRKIKACLQNYMEFAAWRLTDGDGNNFQIAESAAGLLCAMVLQEQNMVERFLYGYNGIFDLLSAVLLDDGMYFEEASGYVRLAGELFFDIANAAENYGVSVKDVKIPASFDRNILHAPWAMRESWAEDGKPFLGMSFSRFEEFRAPAKCMKDYFDTTAKLLDAHGRMFAVNDSNEQDFTGLYQRAYYLYGEEHYRTIGEQAKMPEVLFVREGQVMEGAQAVQEGQAVQGAQAAQEGQAVQGAQAAQKGQAVQERRLAEKTGSVHSACGRMPSLLLPGAGFGILREVDAQAVLKFGVHGGYHGHFDRLSLASFFHGGKTFHNNEYAWYGYGSFLFKMWVQTSLAHNMVVVDGRMQKPSPCRCIFYEPEGKVFCGENCTTMQDTFRAVCAETTTEWIDPPYGGQTPYPFSFPEEKCAKEGRLILMPDTPRKQGEIGEYSEPIFQRRLLILFHGYCIVWDYLAGQQEHRYDCLYHPMGRFDNEDGFIFTTTRRFVENPFGAGQFITNCHTVKVQGAVCLRFHDAPARVNPNDIMDFTPENTVWRAWPASGAVTVARYPQRSDHFTEEEFKETANFLQKPLKKTVSFTVKGKTAEFITILEAGEKTGKVKSVCCKDFSSLLITENTGEEWEISVTGMEQFQNPGSSLDKGGISATKEECHMAGLPGREVGGISATKMEQFQNSGSSPDKGEISATTHTHGENTIKIKISNKSKNISKKKG